MLDFTRELAAFVIEVIVMADTGDEAAIAIVSDPPKARTVTCAPPLKFGKAAVIVWSDQFEISSAMFPGLNTTAQLPQDGPNPEPLIVIGRPD